MRPGRNFYAIDPNGQQKWLFGAERELAGIWTTAALSVDASVFYFGANKGGMYALNARDGSLKWQLPIVGSIYGSAPVADALDRNPGLGKLILPRISRTARPRRSSASATSQTPAQRLVRAH